MSFDPDAREYTVGCPLCGDRTAWTWCAADTLHALHGDDMACELDHEHTVCRCPCCGDTGEIVVGAGDGTAEDLDEIRENSLGVLRFAKLQALDAECIRALRASEDLTLEEATEMWGSQVVGHDNRREWREAIACHHAAIEIEAASK